MSCCCCCLSCTKIHAMSVPISGGDVLLALVRRSFRIVCVCRRRVVNFIAMVSVLVGTNV